MGNNKQVDWQGADIDSFKNRKEEWAERFGGKQEDQIRAELCELTDMVIEITYEDQSSGDLIQMPIGMLVKYIMDKLDKSEEE